MEAKNIRYMIESNRDSNKVVEAITTGRIPVENDTIRFLEDNGPFLKGDTAIVKSIIYSDDNGNKFSIEVEGTNGESASLDFNKDAIDSQFEFVYKTS